MAIPQLIFAGLTIPPAKSVNAAAGQVRTISAAADRALVPVTYGEDRVVGLVLNVLISASDPGAMLVQVLWGHACDSITAPLLNGEALPSGATVTHYTGTQTTANAALVAAFAGQSITYTDTLQGYAYSVFSMPVTAFSGQLTISATVRGRKVYDPRKDSTAGGTGAHRLADPSTWEWSDCPALCLADWIANAAYGAGEAVLWSSVPAAANANDAMIGTPAEKRRILGLTITSAAPIADMAEAMRAYAGCWLVPTVDGVRLLPDADGAAVATYAHAAGNIAAIAPLQLPDRAASPTVVEVVYSELTASEKREASAEAALPGVGSTLPYRRSLVRLPGIQRYSQAHREAVQRLNKLSLEGVATTLEVFDEGLRHERGDLIQVTHPIGLAAEKMRVVAVDMAGPGRWLLDLMRHDPASYSDEVVVAGTIADPSRRLNPGPASAVTGAAATVSAGLIRVTWAPCPDTGYDSTEVRLTNADWGSYVVAPLFRGKASEFPYLVTAAGSYTFHLRHISNNNPSATTTTVTLSVTAGDLPSQGTPTLVLSPPSVNLEYVHGIGITDIAKAVTQLRVIDPQGVDITAAYTFSKVDSELSSTISGNTLTVNSVGDPSSASIKFLARLNGSAVDIGPSAVPVSFTGSAVTIASSGGPFLGTGCGVFTGSSAFTDTGRLTFGPIPADFAPVDTSWSLACWVKFDNVTGGRLNPFVGIREPGVSISFYEQGAFGASAPYIAAVWYPYLQNATNSDSSPTAFSSTLTSPTSGAGAVSWNSSVWYYVEFNWDALAYKLRLFRDGVLLSEQTPPFSGQALGAAAGKDFTGRSYWSTFNVGKNEAPDFGRGLNGAIADICYRVGGIVNSSNYAKPTSPATQASPPSVSSASITATPIAGGSSLSAAFYVNVAVGSGPVITVVPSSSSGVVNAAWDNSSQSYAASAMTYSVFVDGIDQTSLWQARARHNRAAADMRFTLSRGSFIVTNKAVTDDVIATITLGRNGYKTQAFEYLLRTSLAPRPTVIAGGPASLSVRADWADTANANLPLSATIAAMEGATNEAGSYTWSRTSTAGLTTTISGSTVTLTGMASGTLTGTITVTGTRTSWPTLTWTIAVTKSLDPQPVVVVGGPASLSVAGATDGSVPSASLPVTATLTAQENGANVTGSYTWSVTASAGITASISSGSTVQITAMAQGTDTGTLSVTATRSGWPTRTWVIAVTKTRLLLPSGAVVTTIPPITLYESLVSGGVAEAKIRFRTDGTIQVGNASGWGANFGTPWYNPTGGTPGNSHDIFYAGTWSALTSDVVISASASGDGNSDTEQGTYLIAASSNRNVILGQGTIYIYCYVTPAGA